MTHTPGPWIINHHGLQQPTGDYDHIHAESNNALQAICKVVRRHDGNANARLIAAAPDMLDLLKDLLAIAKDCDDREMIERMETVINKAEGK